ncbi:MAG: cellulase family glycosylhydrolase [Rivularia sp. (in: Bacteria)]|nr:cellulase family glycosylhydrolase [Rivularia sp. MS3]
MRNYIFLFLERIFQKLRTTFLKVFYSQYFHQKEKNLKKNKFQKIKPYKKILIFIISLLFCLNSNFTNILSGQASLAKAVTTMKLPLSTRGAKIVDAKGNRVLLQGVNWFGMETETHAPHGLWKRDYKEMLAQIKTLGYNMIRLPYSVETLRLSEISGVDFTIGSNRELEGKTPIEIMDAVVEEAQRQGLLILLDSHRLNNKRIPELWYGDGYSEADWINTWLQLAQRYKNQTNVIGADLKNEPHGKASWGTNDLATDWRLAAERAGNAISKINPNWLIVVEGVESNVPGQKLAHHWQGGNLEGVLRYPVRLSQRNKLVYSPHEYGPGVYDMPYFSDEKFPQNLLHRWQIGFHYISSQNRAPILIGEFGGRLVDNEKEAIWFSKLIKYIKKKKLSFAVWSWNPNSEDTGGILLDDWKSVDIPKQQLISQLFRVKLPQMPAARATQAQKPQTQIQNTNPVMATATGLQLTTKIYSDWQTGFCTSLKIINNTNQSVQNWQLKFNMNQAKIKNSWNANFKEVKGTYTVTPLDWGKTIQPQKVRDVGFCARKLGSDYSPQQVKLQVLATN